MKRVLAAGTRLGFPCMLILMLLLAACGKSGESSHEHTHTAPNGDLREVTVSGKELPAFLDGHPENTVLAYQAAEKIRDTLQWIPCYCGCGVTAGHKSNLECFIHAVREDGTVEWDDHGTRCNVCVSIALESARLKMEGKSDLQIRKMIDAKYSKGYAAPTDTPLPPA